MQQKTCFYRFVNLWNMRIVLQTVVDMEHISKRCELFRRTRPSPPQGDGDEYSITNSTAITGTNLSAVGPSSLENKISRLYLSGLWCRVDDFPF